MNTVMHASMYMLFPLHHTAVIPPPQLFGLERMDSVARFVLGAATAERSERYISSLERTDLGVPLEVEFEETQSTEVIGDMIDRHVSAPGAVYNVQIWSINGASFSYDPVAVATTLLFDTGIESGDVAHYTNCLRYIMHFTLLFHSTAHVQPPLSLDCCLSPASSLMALSSTGYHQENPMEDQCMRLSMKQMTPTSLQWTPGVTTPTTT